MYHNWHPKTLDFLTIVVLIMNEGGEGPFKLLLLKNIGGGCVVCIDDDCVVCIDDECDLSLYEDGDC